MINKMFKKKLFLLITLIGLVFFQFKLSSQTIQTFNTVGAQSWTCPAGVTSVTVQCWGGGGGGGGGGTVFDAVGGGGGGGAYASSVLAVTPGNTYSIIVGAGGAGGASTGGGGGVGGTSTFNSTNVMAVGGNGGGGASTAVAGTAGFGGASASCLGTFKYSGGNGAVGTPTLYAGGGGSSAGSSINGNNANADIGGVAPAGGVAGSSYTTIVSALIGASGSVGLSGGGGASGGRRGSSSTTNRSGGFGGAGKVVLSYCSTNDGGSTIPTNQTICIGQLPSSLSLSGAVGTTYQWQSSNTGGASWTNISGATASTLNNAQMGTPTATTWYRALVINGSCPAVASNYAVVNVNPNPMFSVNSAAICAGSSAVLTASGGAGGTTYNWSPSSGLNTTNGPSVTSSVLATTQYVVTATLNGCSTNVTTTVTVNANPSITTTQTNVSCTGGNDGIIDLTVTGGIQNNNNIILDVQTFDDICSTGDIDSWQSFTPTFTARLAAFEVKLDGPDNGNWYLYKGTGVGGVLLASGTYTATAAAGYKYISIPSLPQLTAGQICTFRLTNFSADWLLTCSPNNYSGGQDNNNNADDRVFKTHMILNPYSYLWSNGAVTEDVSNLVAGPYTVTVTDAVGCSAVDTKTITSLGPLAITASASATTICAGSTSTLTAFGPLTLDQYSNTGSNPTKWFTANNGQQTFVAGYSGLLRKIRLKTATYSSASGNIVVNLYSGAYGSGTLLKTITYTKPATTNSWDDIIIPGGGVNLTAGSPYYIEIPAGPSIDWICSASDTYVNGSAYFGGAIETWDWNFETYMDLNTYVWNPGALSNPEVAVSPSITTNYTVTVTSSLSCTNSQMVTVNANPVSAGGTASANQSICIGQFPSPITLTGFTGAIQWQSSPDNSNWINITGATTNALTSAQMGALSATTYYRAMVTSGLCTSVTSNVILITVIAYPTVSVNSATICSGSSTVLTASGAANYSWSTGATTSTISVSPASTAIYTVTGTTSGCATTISQTITVNATPTISVNSATICAGATVPLTANGAAAYSWAPGSSLSATTGLSVTSSPSITTIYTISGTTNGCSAINTSTVTVNNNPTVTATSSPTAICVGSSANLTATGASTYTWNPGALTGSLVSVSPSATTIYTVTGTSAAGCVKTQTINLIVNNNPTVTATTSPTAICVGSSANLTASGASTYTWNPGTLTGTLVSVNPTVTTIYTVTGTSAAGCVSTKTLSLIVNNNPTLTAIPSPTAICVGSSANLTASGASTYTWNPGALTGSLVSVSPTTTTIYTVTGTSSAGCVNTLTINLIVNNNPTVTATSSSTALCVGSSANLTATGASTYTWNPGLLSGSNPSVNPVLNTTYTVTGDNGTGCIGSETISIIVNSLPIANAVLPSSDTICYDGAVAVGLNSQAGITSFSWTSSYGVSNNAQFPTFTNVTSVGNVYFYGSVMDINGCISLYDTVLVVVTPSITLSALTADVSCFGLTDGLIDLSAAGGFAPYSYSWSNSSFTEDLSSLPAGNYSVTVNDASTCTTSLSVIITEPTSLVANSVESSFIGCNGGNGILTVTATGGTGTYIGTGSYTVVAGNYTYTVTDANGCSSTTTINVNEPTQIVATANITSPIACNGGNALLTVSAIGGAGSYAGTGTYTVAAGNYTYTVTDANGCSSTTTISVTEPTSIVANVSITAPIACNGDNAILTVSATGGSGAYTGAGTFTVAAGNYTYTVIDANGCSSTTTISVTEPTPIVANVSITSPITCNGGNAFLTVSATGGAGTYIGTGTYTVAAGNYTYTVTDANGCSSTATISVTEPTAIVANVNITAPIACNGGNAILTVSATGGTGLYLGTGTYTVAAGNYTYTVTDANGCSSTTTISVTEPTSIVANVSITAPIACNGDNAILTVSATGGTGAYTGAGTFTVAAGNYTYTVTDANGCSSNATITVTQPSPIQLIASATNSIICLGQNTILNGTGVNTYTWSPGLLLGASVTVTPNASTTYTVNGTNGAGCLGTQTISINVNSLPVVNAGANQTICNSQPVTLTGSGSATSYTWNNGAINGTAFTPTISNSYIVTGTDLNNCSNTDTMDVTVNSILTLTLSASTSSICSGATATLTANGASTYTWNPGLLSGSNPLVNPNSTTTYTVVGDNGTGCVGTETISLIVQQLPNIIANATSTTICVGQSVTLNGAGAANYSWSNGVFDGIAFTPTTTNLYTIIGTNAFGCSSTNTIIVNVNNGTSATPNANPSIICFGDTVQLSVIGGSIPTWSLNSNPSVLTISPMSNISYTYSAIDTLGCVGDITFNVNINQDCDIIVYNGFTPNGDGLNDFWIIDNIEKFPNNKVYVFNRWGNKIFQTTEYNNTNNVWDGKLNGQLVPSGTYFYVIESELLIKKGWIEITN